MTTTELVKPAPSVEGAEGVFASPASITPVPNGDLQSVITEIKAMRQEELQLVGYAKQNQLEATCVAFRIGVIINGIQAEYGDNKMTTVAQECGFSKQTAYNYVHLARGAILEAAILEHPDLNREYWQALGSAIKLHQDLIGVMLRHNFLTHPLWANTDDPEDMKPDVNKILDIGKLVKDTRKYLRDSLGIAYAFEKPVSYDEDDNGFFLDFTCKDGDEDKVKEGLQEIGKLFDVISRNTGWPERLAIDLTAMGADPNTAKDEVDVDPSDTAKAILHKKHVRRRIKKIESSSSTSAKSETDDKVCFGRCEVVLNDDAKFPPRSIDVVLTDPPYSNEYYEAWRDNTEVDHHAEKTILEQAELVGNVAELLVQRNIIKQQFIWFSFCPIDYVHEFLPPILNAFNGSDCIHQVLVWDKMRCPKVGGNRTFGRQAEAILYVNVGNKPLAVLKQDGKPRYLHSSLMSVPFDNKKADGANYWKPLNLLKHLIKLSTYENNKEGQTILDCFAGSGSTGVAAIECGRQFRLIESHRKQWELARANVLESAQKCSQP